MERPITKRRTAAQKRQKEFAVWINQVNQTFVIVKAENKEEAKEKAYRKWRREEAHSTISYVEEVSNG